VQTVHNQDTSAHLQDTTITTSHQPFTPIFTLFRSNTCPVPGIFPPLPACIFLIYLLAYRLALCYQSNRHSTSTTTTTHEKKHKLNDSLAIANDPTHHLRVEPFHKSKDRKYGPILHSPARCLANCGFSDKKDNQSAAIVPCEGQQ
jgi:hypothetical protein